MRYWHPSRFTILGAVFLTSSLVLPGCNRSTSGGYHEITEAAPDEAIGVVPRVADNDVSAEPPVAVDSNGAEPVLTGDAVDPETDELVRPSRVKLLIEDKHFNVKGPQNSLRITYDDFDLLKILNMEPVPPDALEHFPKWLNDLAGKRVCVRGFMYPPFQDTGISSFILARDNQICCFGDQNAKPYDLVVIGMREGVTTDYIVDRPFDVVGTFHIEPMMRSDDAFYSLYRIKDATIVDR